MKEIFKTTIAQLFARSGLQTEENKFLDFETRATPDLSVIEPRHLKNKASEPGSLKKTTETEPKPELK